MIKLRDYQQESHDAIIAWVRSNLAPCLIEAATGAGKSFIIAKVADTLLKLSGKGVLCIAPSAELVEQNREKYLITGEPASIYSASLGRKDMRHPVVFGTPGTLKNKAHKVGSKFCAVVIDEAHGITPTVRHIIDEMKRVNSQLRVIGLTATPYRLNTGYIYQLDENDKPVADYEAVDPYFAKLVHKIPAHLLIDRGYLTPPKIGDTDSHYDTKHLQVNGSGRFNAKEVDRAFVGRGRKTSKIVSDIVARSQSRQGVMIFAATVQHAYEIMESLPPQLSAIVTGSTKKGERKDILKRFKRKEVKYLVNVSVLTTGFDAPHVDVVALLRATESVGLLQQIIGRGLRLDDGKEDCLILDYAQNIERHCPDGDIFNPNIVAYKKSESVPLVCCCPSCGSDNTFSMRKNDEGYEVSNDGYFVDLEGNKIQTDAGPMPAHYGRRCQNIIRQSDGEYDQCGYRWTTKKCYECDADNDIAARYCSSCKAEIVDPNEKLRLDFARFKADPKNLQTDKVLSMSTKPTISQQGNECLRVDFVTEYRRFSVWMPKTGRYDFKYRQFMQITDGGNKLPNTVTYKKNAANKFYEIHGYNDEVPEMVECVR